ncbi:MAG: GTPase HflX [Deltaproteobacteria bacterium]|nr:GTPase HflX [Deltaproteobacteria bacterium]
MKNVCGEIKSLRASELSGLEKLAQKRLNPHRVLSYELARKAIALANQLQIQIALIITRDSAVEYVIAGTKNRIYLPNLGRYRLDMGRLRRLRLLVFKPYLEEKAKSQEIARDLITDLEKLRLDCLAVISSTADALPGAMELVYLEPTTHRPQMMSSKSRPSVELTHKTYRDVSSCDIDFNEFVAEIEARLIATREKSYDTSKELALLVGAYTDPMKECEASMMELEELATTAGIEIVDTIIQRRRDLDPRTLVGKGKLEEIVLHSLDLGADLLIFDRELNPAQLRSITNLTELRVIDRSMLILDIFAQRARTSEGRLQVELAQLKYSLPRLTETDTGLSRLTGGIGGRGPGETKLEIGRRRARDHIILLEKKIEAISSQRGRQRRRRQERGVPVVAIVGYTNAGKSTLLNALTKGNVLVENKLFATLDPTSRRMRFPNEKEVLFVDTVGFIRDLPKELINAFRATLEEVGEADLLLHMVDVSNPEMMKQIEVVAATLEKLGYGDKPRLLVLNKSDLLSAIEVQMLSNRLNALPISAVTRSGLTDLVQTVQEKLQAIFVGQDPGRFLEIEQIPSLDEESEN